MARQKSYAKGGGGWVNKIKVTCRHCRQNSFIVPKAGGWTCTHCGKPNG